MSSLAGRTTPVLDEASVARLRATFTDEDGLRDILNEFLVSSGRLLGQLTSALERQRTLEVERAAHTLKSMAKLVGATDLAEACRAVEFRAHGASAPPVLPHMVTRVAVHLRQAQEAVERLLR
ncbi:MAG TPA: Hpt domain-containing protein [Candidatus Thermoplasmatota archaeon]|nr:Hpt domain-containing protein [Candidatus Thermoplasmatota archaeon]